MTTDLLSNLGQPLLTLVSVVGVAAAGGAILINYMDKRERAMRESIRTEFSGEIADLEKRVEDIEGRCRGARALNAECISAAADLGPPGQRIRDLLVRQAGVLG